MSQVLTLGSGGSPINLVAGSNIEIQNPTGVGGDPVISATSDVPGPPGPGVRVFVQENEPMTAQPGDIWLQP